MRDFVRFLDTLQADLRIGRVWVSINYHLDEPRHRPPPTLEVVWYPDDRSTWRESVLLIDIEMASDTKAFARHLAGRAMDWYRRERHKDASERKP